MRKPLISGNWKMNLNHFEAIQTVQKLAYLVGKDGTILWKQTGPFTPEVIRNRLMPEIEKALAAQ